MDHEQSLHCLRSQVIFTLVGQLTTVKDESVQLLTHKLGFEVELGHEQELISIFFLKCCMPFSGLSPRAPNWSQGLEGNEVHNYDWLKRKQTVLPTPRVDSHVI